MSHDNHQPINPFKDYESGGIALVGLTTLGVGISLVVPHLTVLHVLAGAIIGCGLGFIAMALLSRDRYK